MRDPGWNMRYLRVDEETSYTIEVPSIFYRALAGALTVIQNVKTFEVFVEERFTLSPRAINAAIREVENTLKEIETNFRKIIDWADALQTNNRHTISGAEYWELVNLLKAIKDAVERNDGKIIVYPEFYASNLDELRKIFEARYFDTKMDAVMQPLYKELKKCREAELALPKYQF